jgi:hypothetical protein
MPTILDKKGKKTPPAPTTPSARIGKSPGKKTAIPVEKPKAKAVVTTAQPMRSPAAEKVKATPDLTV